MNAKRTSWIALIRAIGPATHKLMSMEQLRISCTEAGFEDVRTVLATGNVVFSAHSQMPDIKETLTEIIASHQLKNDVFLRQPKDLETVLARNPFPEAAAERPNHLLVLFVEYEVGKKEAAALRDYDGPEHIEVSGKEIFIDYTEGVGRSKLTPVFLERRLGQPGTARNWNTINRLLTTASQ